MYIKEIYKLYAHSYLVDTDTRLIRKGAIFFALKGENFNGNKFAEEAIEKGASFAIIDEEAYLIDGRTILVKDALQTLQELAAFHRNILGIPVIALTGSNGKTTTKELISSVLKTKYTITSTKGNFNNHIGVPLTLLSMTPKTEVAVVEMGANHQKEIALLSKIANPDYGFITNFGKAHLEGFGSEKGVIEGKSELYDFLRESKKIAIVNPKDPIQMDKTIGIERILLDKSVKLVSASPYVLLTFNDLEIRSNLIGEYNFTNIRAAITCGMEFGIDIGIIKEAIEKYIPVNNRSQIIKKGKLTVILDAYNANPSSMKCSIESFRNMKASFKSVILGDMFELGSSSEKEHQEIIDLLKESSFDQCYLVGEAFYKTHSCFEKFKTFHDLKEHIENGQIYNEGNLLIKGSRGMSLERVLDII